MVTNGYKATVFIALYFSIGFYTLKTNYLVLRGLLDDQILPALLSPQGGQKGQSQEYL